MIDPIPEMPTWRKQDWAYEQVREWIMSNKLKPGQLIDQEKLAEELGISRIPLRQGLGRLISEGLIRDNPHRQWAVTELTKGDVRDIYSGREALEGLLAAEAAAKATDDDLAAMTDALDRQEALLAAGGIEEFRRTDRLFHDALNNAAGMPKTHAALDGLFTMSDRYIRIYQSDASRAAASYAEHREIFAAVAAHDSARASALVRAHVSRGRTLLEESGGDDIG
jgi:DNA-binding GntR family transcriptional regulator